MQEMIESGLLMAVAALSVILLLIGQRPSSGMTKKQKIMLGRILTATVLLLALQTLGAGFFDRLGTTTNKDGKRTYRSTPSHCKNCPNKWQCGANEKGQKMLTTHIWQEYLDIVEGIRKTERGREFMHSAKKP